MPLPGTIPGWIQLLDNETALPFYTYDIEHNWNVYAEQYLISEEFFTKLWDTYLQERTLHLLTDNRQRQLATALVTRYKHLHVNTWSYNRTMHAKATVFADTGVSWIGSHNWTRGSWTLSQNTTTRIASHSFARQLLNRIEAEMKAGKRVSAMGKRNPSTENNLTSTTKRD